MTNALVQKTSDFATNLALFDPYMNAKAFKDDIRPYLANLAAANPELKPLDFIEFVQTCALTGADPRLKQVYLIPHKKKLNYKGEKGWVEEWITVATTVFSYHFFICKAQGVGDYEGYKIETVKGMYFNPFTGHEVETLCSLATVKRKDREPFTYRAWLPEFVKLKDNFPTEAWANKPYLMLEKCSTANAFRLTWPETMGGMYVSEEMQGEETKSDVNAAEKAHAHVVDYRTKVKPPEPRHPSEMPHAAPCSKVEPKPVEAEADVPLDNIPPAQQNAPIMCAFCNEPRMTCKHSKPFEIPKAKDAPAPGPTIVPQPIQAVTVETKKALWKHMQHLSKSKLLDLQAATQRLDKTPLSEEQAADLVIQLSKGDVSFFK